jgi:2-amino-4-hydroxy-6-hydroxymethyldihydropteridine diphosphokinase
MMIRQDLWVEAYIGLGSNLDDPLRQVQSAVEDITALPGIEIVEVSPLYGSRPVGPADQPDYVNAVMRIKTSLAAADLLQTLQKVENQHGRLRLVHWGARTLDLDILLYGDQCIHQPDLIVPHSELANRAFVLYPLADIAGPDLMVPGKGRLAQLCAACPPDGLQRLN